MKRLAFVISMLLLLPAASRSGDLSLGFGYPYVSAKYDFSAISAEGRFITGAGINIYSARGYWNFYRAPSLTGFAGVEGGYIKFNALNMKGTGYEGALFVGGQYRLTGNFYLLMDFAPTLILLRHAVYTDVEVAGVEFVVNAGVYYRFGGGRTARTPRTARPSPAVMPAKRTEPSETEDMLLKKLYSADWQERRRAASELGKARSAPAVKQLMALLFDDNEKVRGVAALALGQIGDGRALTPLVAKLNDNSPYVRASAARALSDLNDKRALPWLEGLTKDRSAEVRAAAKEAVEQLKFNE